MNVLRAAVEQVYDVAATVLLGIVFAFAICVMAVWTVQDNLNNGRAASWGSGLWASSW